MPHTHPVNDDYGYDLKINVKSRDISVIDNEKIMLVRGDHNCERITFTMDREVDGHDMSQCDKVQIHYINVGHDGASNADIYEVNDFRVDSYDDSLVTFSWLISRNATQHVGSLSFAIRFKCLNGENVDYSWSTIPFSGITVATTIDGGEAIVEVYSDILEEWYSKLTLADAEIDNAVENAVREAENVIHGKYSVVEESYVERGTATGIDIIDGMNTELVYVKGSSFFDGTGTLINSVLEKIISTSPDGKSYDYVFPKNTTLGAYEYIDVTQKQKFTRQGRIQKSDLTVESNWKIVVDSALSYGYTKYVGTTDKISNNPLCVMSNFLPSVNSLSEAIQINGGIWCDDSGSICILPPSNVETIADIVQYLDGFSDYTMILYETATPTLVGSVDLASSGYPAYKGGTEKIIGSNLALSTGGNVSGPLFTVRQYYYIDGGYNADYTNVVARLDVHDDMFESQSDLISRNDKRITNLEKGITPDPFVVDDTVAYSKSVPANSTPYAGIQKVGGMSYKTRNLIPYPYYSGATQTSNGITFTYDGGEAVTVNGTATNKAYYILAVLTPKTLRAGTYYINVGTNSAVQALIEGYHGSSWYNTIKTGNGNFTVDWNGYTSIRVMLYIYTGTTVSNVTIYPMLNPGETGEPYATYFEGLRSAPVTEVVSTGVNLFDQDTWLVQQGAIPQSDGSYKCNAINRKCFVNEQRISGSVFISVDYKTDATNRPFIFHVVYTNGNSEYSPYATQTTSFKKISFTSAPNLTVDYIVWTFAEIADYYAKNAMISFVDRDYTPYKEPSTLPIPTTVQALDGYGDGVNATLYNSIEWGDDGKTSFNKLVSPKVTLCGNIGEDWKHNNGWGQSGTNYFAIRLEVNDLGRGVQKCLVSDPWRFSAANPVDYDVGTNYGWFTFYTSAITSLEEWKAYLQENPIEVVYALAEPEARDITNLITPDNFIEVEPYGTLTFENEHKCDVPSTVYYQVKKEETV